MNRSAFNLVIAAIAVATTATLACAGPTDETDTTDDALETLPQPSDARDARDGRDGGASLAAQKAAVQGLFSAQCAPCHTERTSGGLSLLDFTTTTVGVAASQLPTMKRISPKNREQSYLFHKLKGTHRTVGGSGAQMPARGSLTADQIETVGKLIDAL